jgi:hypothetical protein
MTTDDMLVWLRANERLGIAIGLGVVALVLLAAWFLRRKGRDRLARRVTTAATLLGLGWSAQGMWDTAVHHYGQDIVVASVLFVVFEAMLAARMLKAHQYRSDYARRGRHIRSVFVFASAMATVVALGEGWTQAPARLAIPLLVAYGWYVDLVADDDPKDRPKTSLRWTPRRLGLWIGMLEPGERDAQTIDRDRLRDRLTKLAFRKDVGDKRLNDLLHRPERIRRLLTLANDADVAEVRARLARSRVDLMAPPVVAEPMPKREIVVPTVRIPRTDPAKQGVHTRGDKVLRGPELRADAVERMIASVSETAPTGMTTAALAALYTPPLKDRTAETLAAEGRKAIRERANGHAIN